MVPHGLAIGSDLVIYVLIIAGSIYCAAILLDYRPIGIACQPTLSDSEHAFNGHKRSFPRNPTSSNSTRNAARKESHQAGRQ